jgi:hypothetical protein
MLLACIITLREMSLVSPVFKPFPGACCACCRHGKSRAVKSDARASAYQVSAILVIATVAVSLISIGSQRRGV